MTLETISQVLFNWGTFNEYRLVLEFALIAFVVWQGSRRIKDPLASRLSILVAAIAIDKIWVVAVSQFRQWQWPEADYLIYTRFMRVLGQSLLELTLISVALMVARPWLGVVFKGLAEYFERLSNRNE